jgi:hypothetical protein
MSQTKGQDMSENIVAAQEELKKLLTEFGSKWTGKYGAERDFTKQVESALKVTQPSQKTAADAQASVAEKQADTLVDNLNNWAESTSAAAPGIVDNIQNTLSKLLDKYGSSWDESAVDNVKSALEVNTDDMREALKQASEAAKAAKKAADNTSDALTKLVEGSGTTAKTVVNIDGKTLSGLGATGKSALEALLSSLRTAKYVA